MTDKTKDKQTSLITQPETSQGANGGNKDESKAVIPEIIADTPIKHPGAGRPLKWDTPTKLSEAIEEYFSKCNSNMITKKVVQRGEVVSVEIAEPYTMAGLACHLHIDRTNLLRGTYLENKELRSIVAHARRKIETQNITHGMIGCHDSRIAALNLAANYGYSDKSEVKHTVTPLAPQALEKESEAGK